MDNSAEERLLIRSEGEDSGDLKKRIWVESKKIWRVTFPGILARVTSFGLIVVTQSFIGHISELDLAAYALVQTLIVRFVNGILLGMSSATETLCGQAFGAGQYHMMGIYLQRSWIVDFVTATILLPFFIFTTPLFRLLGEEDAISNVSESISLWFIPFVYNFVFGLTIQMYLQAQLKNMVIAWLSTASLVFHLFVSWLFVIKLDLGIPGAMASLTISSWLVIIAEFVYVFGGWCPNSWKGFTIAAFSNLWPLVKLSVSSGIMLCLELWYNSVLVLVAGYMKNAEVAISAFSICLNFSGWEFMVCLGFLGAACVRVANELGRGDAKAVKFSIKVIMCTSSVLGLVFFVLCLIFGNKMGYFFTDDEEVVEAVSELSVLLAFTMLFNSIQPVLTGKQRRVAVGAGLQSIVAVLNLCCYYVIGIPIGIVLAYVADLEVKGLWIGMISGVATQVAALGFLIWRTDWDVQVNKASERLNRWFVKPSEEADESLNHAELVN
ncbi:Protein DETOXIFICATION like [Actinidia chinensis var. chinensis]|uniref:Protein DETOXIFICATION n=1 Tax=Actinidia chinensis var. chinensis TaxID=1590841 RepID=A0A2R6QVL9_ACTCC|nr:Protein DETOXIFICATION like [Actinidia chinensis var. chinensis]